MKVPSREQLLHDLYEAAELEHDLMCMYLYAAFTIKSDPTDGITAEQADRASRWRRAVVHVALEEMCHLTSVWNITSALGGSPHFGRGNFPIETGALPASVVARLAPFDEDVLQHFTYLERPRCSEERDGAGFPHPPRHMRATPNASLTPMPIDYETVGAFYATLGEGLRSFVAVHGEEASFSNDPSVQVTSEDMGLPGVHSVRCSQTALASFSSIVEQGEGAPADTSTSHYRVFRRVREELSEARRGECTYVAAYPSARDPVLRPPIAEGRMWITDADAVMTVDLANATYGLMLRMLAYAYQVPRGVPQRRVAIDVALGLMHAMTPLAERAVRLPLGSAYPGVNAGMTFTTLRDAAALPRGASTWRFFSERLDELVDAATMIASSKDARVERALRILVGLAARARRVTPDSVARPGRPVSPPQVQPRQAPASTASSAPSSLGERVQGTSLGVFIDSKRCIHARFCVTGSPAMFRANIAEGPWIFPDEGKPEHLREIVHACPSGALHYELPDGTQEPAPEVNLIAIRERGPYAIRADAQLEGAPAGYRMTLCRCGASKNKPYCDSTHVELNFDATGEPPTTRADPLPERAGPLEIEPAIDGPLEISGNVEITSGTGRVVARVTHAKLCRCGASATKPFCDQSHVRIGFRSSR